MNIKGDSSFAKSVVIEARRLYSVTAQFDFIRFPAVPNNTTEQSPKINIKMQTNKLHIEP